MSTNLQRHGKVRLYTSCKHAHTHAHTCTRTSMLFLMHKHSRTHTYFYLDAHTSTPTHTYTHSHILLLITHTSMHAHTNAHTRKHTCMHTRMHTTTTSLVQLGVPLVPCPSWRCWSACSLLHLVYGMLCALQAPPQPCSLLWARGHKVRCLYEQSL